MDNELLNCPMPAMRCFALNDGKCTCLSDTRFGAKMCPFFKTENQVIKERARMTKRKEVKA